jgi:hypothetical protein
VLERVGDGERPLLGDDHAAALKDLRASTRAWYAPGARGRASTPVVRSRTSCARVIGAVESVSVVNITVDLKERSYDVVVDEGARDHLADLLARALPTPSARSIVTSAVARGAAVVRSLRAESSSSRARARR